MADKETVLRTLWDAMGVDKFTQDTVINSINEAARPLVKPNPFAIDGVLAPHHYELMVAGPGRDFVAVQSFDEYEPALGFRDILEYEMGYTAILRPAWALGGAGGGGRG
jgi:hypothetical protein